MHQEPSGTDSGLGPESIDPSTQILEVSTDTEALVRLESKGRGYWIATAVIVILLCEQAGLTIVLYTPLLSDLAVEWQTTNIIWFITSIFLAGAVLTPLMAKCGDLYGKRKVLLVGTAVLAAGSLVVALASNFTAVLAGRLLMAVSVGFLALCVSLVSEVFPPRYRALTIGVAMSGAGIIGAGGPLLAGWLDSTWGVRAPLYFQFGTAIICFIALASFIPETPVRVVNSRLDYVGLTLLAGGLVGLSWGLSQGQSREWDGTVLTSIAAGLALLVAWYIQSSKSKDPIISVKLLRRRAVSTTVAAAALYNALLAALTVVFALMWATPHALADFGRDFDPLEIGVWFLPLSITATLTGWYVGVTYRAIGYRIHMITAGAAVAIAALWFAFNLSGSLGGTATMMAVFGLGFLATSSSAALIVLATPPGQRATALSMSAAVSSIVGAAVQQVVQMILSESTTVVDGFVLYSAESFKITFLFIAGTAVVGIVASIAIPHGRRLTSQRDSTSGTHSVAKTLG